MGGGDKRTKNSVVKYVLVFVIANLVTRILARKGKLKSVITQPVPNDGGAQEAASEKTPSSTLGAGTIAASFLGAVVVVVGGRVLFEQLPLRDLKAFATITLYITGLLVFIGLIHWLPSRTVPASRSELGAAILGGAVIGFAVLVLQLGMEQRTEILESQRQAAAARQNTQIALQNVTDLRGRNFEESDLSGLFLQFKDLSRANLSKARLVGTDLRGSDLRGANLQMTDLRGANLNNTALDGAILAGAIVNQNTIFPEGFDFRGAGMILEP